MSVLAARMSLDFQLKHSELFLCHSLGHHAQGKTAKWEMSKFRKTAVLQEESKCAFVIHERLKKKKRKVLGRICHKKTHGNDWSLGENMARIQITLVHLIYSRGLPLKISKTVILPLPTGDCPMSDIPSVVDHGPSCFPTSWIWAGPESCFDDGL